MGKDDTQEPKGLLEGLTLSRVPNTEHQFQLSTETETFGPYDNKIEVLRQVRNLFVLRRLRAKATMFLAQQVLETDDVLVSYQSNFNEQEHFGGAIINALENVRIFYDGLIDIAYLCLPLDGIAQFPYLHVCEECGCTGTIYWAYPKLEVDSNEKLWARYLGAVPVRSQKEATTIAYTVRYTYNKITEERYQYLLVQIQKSQLPVLVGSHTN